MADVLITGCGTTDCNGTYPFITNSSSGGGGGNYGPNPHGYYLFWDYGEWLITSYTDGNGNNYGPPYYYGGSGSSTDPTGGVSWNSYYGSNPGPTIAFAVSYPPNTPTSLHAVSGIGVSLSWVAPSSDSSHGNASTYNLYRSTSSGGTYTAINGSPLTTTSYCDTTGTFSTTYYYEVSAVNAAGESTLSSYVAASNNQAKGTLKSSGVGNLLTDLMAYYTSESANLLTIYDYTTSSNDMVFEGGGNPSFGTDAAGDQIINFDGVCYAGCESPNLTGYPVGGGFSVMWRGTPTSTVNSYNADMFQGLGCYLRWSQSSQNLYFYMTPDSGQWGIGNITNTGYVNTEHVFVLTYDPASGYGRGYIDGSLAAIIHQTGNLNTDSQAYFHLNSGSTAGHVMPAQWKELALWSRALTAQEVTAIGSHRWSLASSEPDPVFSTCPIPTGGLQLFAESKSISAGDSAAIAMIPDQSPKSNDLLQANGSYMPRFYNNVYKTYPSIRFTSGQTYWMSLSNAIDLTGAYTEILVFKNPTNSFFFAHSADTKLIPVVPASDYSLLVVSRNSSGVYTVHLNGADITSTAAITTSTGDITVNQMAKSGGG